MLDLINLPNRPKNTLTSGSFPQNHCFGKISFQQLDVVLLYPLVLKEGKVLSLSHVLHPSVSSPVPLDAVNAL